MDPISPYSRYEPESEHIENVVLGLCAAVATGTMGVLSAYITHPTQESFFYVRAPASHDVLDGLTSFSLVLSVMFGMFASYHLQKNGETK